MADFPPWLRGTWLALVSGERLRPWRWALCLYVLAGIATRLALLLAGDTAAGMGSAAVAGIFLLGVFSDLIAGGLLFMPLALFLLVYPLSFRRHWLGRAYLLAGMAAWVLLVLFVGAAEWVFWGEFGTRFNFIAVDYLVYTHEVITNIWESYPVVPVITVLVALSIAVAWRQQHRIAPPTTADGAGRGELAACLLALALPLCLWSLVPHAWQFQFHNRYANELAANGVYEFFHAFGAAELDYERFYPTLPRAEAWERTRRMLTVPGMEFVSNRPQELQRRAIFAAPPRELNVVLISVESLSAKFMARFGDTRGITPNLDRLAREGLLFTSHYATGTRTVRGLEALSLSVPPTPGESIVKRPENTGLLTLGQVFLDKGYDVDFLYGGYALFDNMAEYFSGNGYQIIDRGDIPREKIHHENAWGVADEDIYTRALEQMDHSRGAGRHAFLHIMTTSNHRPYTYPDQRIDLPSGHSGRPGAVKYTDWAIGDFIARAKRKPWFNDTLFVIVADHCASSAGKTALPPENFHVPLLFYGPGFIAPREDNQLASQVDVAPTILGLLRMEYRARFFGRDLLQPAPGPTHAFISTYQELGLLRAEGQVELEPQSPPQVSRPADAGLMRLQSGEWDEFTRDAIALYQVAAEAFDAGLLRRDAREPGR